MKKMKYFTSLLILLFEISILLQAAITPLAVENQNQSTVMNAQWTAMYYLCGDNKMSASQQQVLQQIQSVGSTNEVQIAVLIDQNQEDDTYLYYLEENQLSQQSWEEESAMDDPETLKDFIEIVMNDLPAEQYYLQLSSNKGSGWQGVCYDERGDGTMITMSELSDLLSDVTNQGVQKIDVIAVETCLGGNLEFAYQLKSYCDYYVGYADCGLAGAWPFQLSISALVENPSMQPSTFASIIVDFFTPQNIPQYKLKTAIGAMDLNEITQIQSNIDSLGQYLIDNIESYQSNILSSLEGIRIYGEMWDIDYYVDFVQFLNNMPFADQEGENLKNQLLSSIESLVINKKYLENDDSEGFNFYFPRNAIDFNHALRYENGILPDNYEQTQFSIDTSWDDFLKVFLGITNNNAPNKPTINGPQNGKAGEEFTYHISTSDPENDDVYYYVNWGDEIESGWIGPHPSGEEITISHSWNEQETYTVKVKARDIKGAESDWETITVSMPKSKNLISEIITTILIGKIADIERDQNQGFRFLPIKLLTIIFGGGQELSINLLDETHGGYPCCCYIDKDAFHGFLSASSILGYWSV